MKEVTTITIDRNDKGDTLKVVQITDRDLIRSKADVRSKKEVVRVERDTVYVAVRDSVVELRNYGATESGNRPSAVARALKWVLAIAFLLLTSVVLVRARH